MTVAVIESKVVALALLRPFPGNAKNHDDEGIQEALRVLGQYRSICVNRPTMEILAGNGTAENMMALGWKEALVDFVEVDRETAVRINAADNRLPQLGPMDNGLLLKLLEEIPDLAGTGYDDEFLNELKAKVAGQSAKPGEDEVPERDLSVQPISKPGDVWLVGKHRIICGDALAIELAMTPDLIVTDPPYGMDLDTDYAKTMNKGGNKIMAPIAKVHAPVTGDAEPYDPGALLARWSDVKDIFLFGFDYYAHRLPEIRDTGAVMVWDKRLDESADKMYGSGFELIWSKAKHKRDILRVKWAGVFGQDTEQRLHPTQKPVELIRHFVEGYSKPGQKVLDPYLGSGSTLIACQDTNRACWGVEIEPVYVDVAVHRLQNRTGVLPIREATGETVDFTRPQEDAA